MVTTGVFLYERSGSMLPELFSIGPFTVYSYGLMTALGIVAAITVGEHEAKRSGVGEDGYILGLGVAAVVGGYVASKLLFWITILPQIIDNPEIILNYLSNGFVVFGGLIGGVLTAYLYCRKKNTDFWKTFDLAAPAVALAQCIGRIGCFLAGCCYGRETESVFGVVFHASSYAPTGVKLFPVQLVSSGLDFLNFVFLFFLWRRAKLKSGMVGAFYIITYSVGRFFLEFFRGDLERGTVGVLSTSQFIAIFTLLIGIVMLFFRQKSSSSDAI